MEPSSGLRFSYHVHKFYSFRDTGHVWAFNRYGLDGSITTTILVGALCPRLQEIRRIDFPSQLEVGA